MGDYFVDGTFIVPKLGTIVMCYLLAFVNNLSDFAAHSICLSEDFIADLGSDVVLVEDQVFYS